VEGIMDLMGTVKVSELQFVYANKNSFNKKELFKLKDGTPIFEGDTVQFFQEGAVFATSGNVENAHGLKIACFSTLLNKWRYWNIDKEE
jgi:hypothetical protein